ncbi:MULTISPECIES: aldose epimerase family protein [Rhizobium/Agrobacterium group]|uniref:Aldose 1-epimerase n=1 Tax=Neorhizobium petrolearium TaxID=515361 RepID=A0ABY8LZ51_9HYPH|nr:MULTISPECIES: aldose epimerase family protein [Rhizobium/Agrobacterium group]KGD87442.1 aldose epimerase [Rhizobium sp. YS-1r]MCC2612471.1 galactose mutarotase [Neorhizobium petrolearium]WGI67600.1 galactose mutarotase [Neorhizobium petrolearium]
MTDQNFEVFGTTENGEPVYRVRIAGGGLTASIITWGAVIQDLRLEGHRPPLVLGFEAFDPYPIHSPYFGATPGRCANRISAGRFTLDGRQYQLEMNQPGIGHLHGGTDGLGRSNWSIVDHAADKVVLQITDPDGRAGYPGNCTVTATYQLKDHGVLSVIYESTTDQPTLANICQHSYFNLDGREDALGHDIMIAADQLVEVDEKQLPTGRLTSVADTPFDLREMGPMKRFDDGKQVLFDHNYCLSPERTRKRSVALARSVYSGVSMEVRTTEPGVQFYAAFKLQEIPVPGLEGRRYGPFAGFCLETQVWPDAINHPNFPNVVLRPGEVLRQETDYVFSKQ